MTDEERLRSLELIIDQGAPFPIAEFAKLTVGSQIALESKVRDELEALAGELGPEGLDAVITHLAGLARGVGGGGAPEELIGDMRAGPSSGSDCVGPITTN